MHNFLTKAAACLLDLVVRFIYRSNRLTVTRREVFEQGFEEGGKIFAFWHSRIFYFPGFYIDCDFRRKVSVLVSMSRDGDYAAAYAKRLKMVATVRGSSSRGGHAAVRQLARTLAEGNNIAITPDGPRGPALKVSDGVIRLAQLTGAKIIPGTYEATRKRRLNSWDRFMVVLPFGRVHMAFGDPIEVPRRMTAAQLEACCQQLERTLLDLDEFCAAQLRGEKAKEPKANSEPACSSQGSKSR